MNEFSLQKLSYLYLSILRRPNRTPSLGQLNSQLASHTPPLKAALNTQSTNKTA